MLLCIVENPTWLVPRHINRKKDSQYHGEMANNRKAVRSQCTLDSRVPSAKKFKTKGH